ncbi:hypothetical protein ElyMa_002319500 [Elysia marginata]|uniref:Portal protein n=1 Tax=Elysia marginata TaxID=1093978 RepID=A0AAV4G4Y5_9GAST|nr:hypothetical protein ElyMa_002319500 [Elysia marginata]
MPSKFVGAKLIELYNRLIKYDKSLGVYKNGEDNNYPSRVERIINNSATAKPSINLFRKYIVGKGFGNSLNDFVVNKDQTTLRRFLFNVAHSYAYQNGVFIHVDYNLNYNITGLKVLPYKHCLIGKKDDKNWSGKILVYDNWQGESGKIDRNKINEVDAYNPNPKVIQSQIKKAGGIKNYKGQIFFYNPEDTIYPLSHIDNVLNDADSEFRVSQYKNTSLLKGFFGKKMVITPPIVESELRKPDDQLSEGEVAEKRIKERALESFRNELRSFVGADNVDGIFHFELDYDAEGIDKAIKFVDIDTNIDDKLFAHTERSVSQNIAKSIGVPSILIDNSDNSIFGNSGALLDAARSFFQEQRMEDIENLTRSIFNPLFAKFQDFPMPEGGLKIIPLFQKTNETNHES